MRHILEHAEPCEDVRYQVKMALLVDAALLGCGQQNDPGWPYLPTEPIACLPVSDLWLNEILALPHIAERIQKSHDPLTVPAD